MAIARTARGTGQAKAVSSLTISGVTVATGSSLVVAVMFDNSLTEVNEVSFDGVPFTQTPASAPSALQECTVFLLENCSGTTADVIVDFGGITVVYVAALVVEVSGVVTSGATDQYVGAGGSGTSPSSGNTATTTQAKELLLGFVGTEGPGSDVAGSWSGSFSDGQYVGTTGGTASQNSTISEGFRVVSSTGAYAAAKTGITSRAWAATIITMKEASTTQTSTPSTLTTLAHVAAATIIIGAVTAGCIRPTAVTHVPTPVTSSASRVDTISHLATPTVPDGLTLGNYNAATQTVQAAQTNSNSQPVTLRCNTSPLGDADWSTYTSQASNIASGSGTLLVGSTGVGQTDITGSGEISGVIFYVAGWTTKDTHITLSNARISGLLGPDAALGSLPNGTHASPPAAGQVNSALIATRDGTNPWTWANLYSGLSGMTYKLDFTNTAVGSDFGQINVADIWVEVWGPIGAAPDVLILKHQFGPTPISQPLGPLDGTQKVPSIIIGG